MSLHRFKETHVMPVNVRKNMGYHAQDAYHYFLAAGGQTLQRKYGESTFSRSNDRTLRSRLQHLENGYEQLLAISDIANEYLPKRAYPYYSDEYRDAETMEQVQKYARIGLKMTMSLCKRFRIAPDSGNIAEVMDAEERAHATRTFWK